MSDRDAARVGPSSEGELQVRELDRLRRENASLGEQVKQLVQLEQSLSRSQAALDRELHRIRALGAFALQVAAVTDREQVLRELCALVQGCIEVDRLALVRWSDGREPPSISFGAGRGAEPFPLSIDELNALRGPEPVILAELSQLSAPLAGVFGRLVAQTTHVQCLVLSAWPVPATILAVSAARRRAPLQSDRLGEHHRPFLLLIATHLRRCLEHCLATEDLRAGSRSLMDVNERLSESLQSLQRTQAQLIESSKMEAIGRLAGGVAHDFNNLLTVIVNHASMVAGALPAGSQELDDVEQILDAGRRASEITAQLLALGRKQIRKGDRIELGEVAVATCRMLRTLVGRGITLDVETHGELPVVADRTQLEQVVMNLVLNARDAMPRGGTVQVTTRAAIARDIVDLPPAARNPAAEELVVLEVSDTGVGMDEATRARAFEPFFTTKPAEHGTGLGLAVVYGVVTHAGGHITVHSELGRGTRITVILPRSKEEHRQVAPAPSPVAAPGARLLVVEDNDAIRRVVARILRRAGYEVVEAGDGMEAMALLTGQKREFDLVLTDLNMPRMSGIELAEHLAIALPVVRVVFMTGFSEELADVTRRAPQWPCVTKPFTPDDLLKHVRAQLVPEHVRAP